MMSFFKSIGLLLVVLATPIGPLSANASERPLVWTPDNGEVLEFDVLRKGKPFGKHKVSFSNDDNGNLIVENKIDLEVKIGFVTFFSYKHESTEKWEDGVLAALEGYTRKEGEDLRLSARREDDALVFEGTKNSGLTTLGTLPTSHWNIGQMSQTTLLSSEGGLLLDVTIDDLGQDSVEILGKTVETRKYRMTADLAVDLWYDEQGRWVKCAFEARGQEIEYILRG